LIIQEKDFHLTKQDEKKPTVFLFSTRFLVGVDHQKNCWREIAEREKKTEHMGAAKKETKINPEAKGG
jgi:hypothetical protein